METTYDDNWIYSHEGQSILRVLSEIAPLDDEESCWSNSLAIEFAKRAYEKGKEEGYRAGWLEGSQGQDNLFPDSCY